MRSINFDDSRYERQKCLRDERYCIEQYLGDLHDHRMSLRVNQLTCKGEHDQAFPPKVNEQVLDPIDSII
jgi:hypothetical protein